MWDKNRQIQDLKTQLQEKERELDKREKQLDEREKQLEERDRQLMERERQLQNIERVTRECGILVNVLFSLLFSVMHGYSTRGLQPLGVREIISSEAFFP